jgi:hypothetical protein
MKNYKFITFLIYFLCLHFIFLGCKKKNEKYTISGTTFNSELNQPVGEIKVVLNAKTVTNGTWNSQYSTLGTTYSNSDGSFSFEFENIRASDFKITLNKTGYFKNEYIINPELVIKGENFNQIYSIHQEAWLKLIIKNLDPTTSNDLMSFKLRKGGANCDQGCNDTLKKYYGSTVNTYNICKIWGSQWAILEWNVSSGSSHVQNIDTLWIAPSDTTIRNLFY